MESEPSLSRVLAAVQSHYLDWLRSGILRTRSEHKDSGEPAVVGLQLAVERKSRFALPFRIDLFIGPASQPKLFQFETKDMVSFDPISVGFLDTIEVSVEPFTWDACDVLADGDLDDWTLPLEWFERWFDREDSKPEDADGIAPVIHEMTEPEVTEFGVAFTVDFGGAPVEAFVDLMVTLHRKGMTNLRVGRFYQRDN